MSCVEKLILTYEPKLIKNNVCETNLTDSSTNCIKRLVSQKNYKLYDLKNIELGNLDAILNTMIYKIPEEEFERISVLGNKVITLYLPTGIEIYSLSISNLSFVPDPLNPTTEIGKFKLTQVSEKYTYTNLEFILTKQNNEPGIRYLIFS
jgi:hypothetical protein